MRPTIALLTLVAGGCAVGEAPPDEPGPRLTRRAYRIDRIDLPLREAQVPAYGFDLDGDATGRIDNTGGDLLVNLLGNFETAAAELPLALQAALDARRLDWQIVVGAAPDS